VISNKSNNINKRVVRSLVFCVMFCRSLSVLLFFFGCPLHCLSVFDLRPRITPVGIFKPFSSLRSRWPWPILAIRFIHFCFLPQNASVVILLLQPGDKSRMRKGLWLRRTFVTSHRKNSLISDKQQVKQYQQKYRNYFPLWIPCIHPLLVGFVLFDL
jgi:hypothetical protein